MPPWGHHERLHKKASDDRTYCVTLLELSRKTGLDLGSAFPQEGFVLLTRPSPLWLAPICRTGRVRLVGTRTARSQVHHHISPTTTTGSCRTHCEAPNSHHPTRQEPELTRPSARRAGSHPRRGGDSLRFRTDPGACPASGGAPPDGGVPTCDPAWEPPRTGSVRRPPAKGHCAADQRIQQRSPSTVTGPDGLRCQCTAWDSVGVAVMPRSTCLKSPQDSSSSMCTPTIRC